MSTEMTSEQLQQIYISNLHGRKRQQPLHTSQAHVFHIDPSTKKSWIPASTSAVPVSFFYDNTRGLYRIISVEGSKPVINCTMTSTMNFTKTSQKFGQWADAKVNTVYGLGFPSEQEIDKFQEQFQEIKDALRLNISSPNKTTNGVVVLGQSAKQNGLVVGTSPNNITSSTLNNKATDSDANIVLQPPTTTIDVNANSVFPLRRPNLVGEGGGGGSPYKIRMESPKRIQYLEKLEMDGRMTPETQLKYENERLRQALQQSSANAKMWELELANLKANNTRLTTALQECTFGVEEWKHQLDMYREENQRLRQQILESEAASGNTNAAGELQKQLEQMRDKVDYCTKLLKQKDDELLMMKDKLSKPGELNESDLVWKTLQKTQTQLQMTVETHNCQRKVLDALNDQLGEKLNDLSGIKDKIMGALQTTEQYSSVSPK